MLVCVFAFIFPHLHAFMLLCRPCSYAFMLICLCPFSLLSCVFLVYVVHVLFACYALYAFIVQLFMQIYTSTHIWAHSPSQIHLPCRRSSLKQSPYYWVYPKVGVWSATFHLPYTLFRWDWVLLLLYLLLYWQRNEQHYFHSLALYFHFHMNGLWDDFFHHKGSLYRHTVGQIWQSLLT